MSEQADLSSKDWVDFRSNLNRYVRRRVDPASADDIVGSVLERLVRHQDKLQAAKNPSAWVRRVTTNAVADHYRRKAAEQRALDTLGANAAAAETPSAATAPDSTSDVARCLKPFIRALPKPYRQALILTDLGGLTQAAAAKRLGLTPSGMKSRVQRARAKLKRALLHCCAIETDRRGGVVDYRPRTGSSRCPYGRT